MGFERPVKLFTLQFRDGRYPGLEVKVRSLSTRQFLQVAGMAEVAMEKLADAGPVIDELAARTAASIASWNLEDDGVPVPVSAESLLEQEWEFFIDIVMAWLDAIGGVSPPLPNGSNGTGQLPEASIPMAPLSPSLSN